MATRLSDIASLKERIAALEGDVDALKQRLNRDSEVIVLRSISREQATEEIRNLFATGRTLYYSDIARELRLDLPDVVDICEELMREGAIEVDGDAVQRRRRA